MMINESRSKEQFIKLIKCLRNINELNDSEKNFRYYR